jgi:IS605 OrfB family transposase
MTNETILSYQTRLILTEEQEKILQSYAFLLSKVERSLYAEIAKGHRSVSCKNAFLKRFAITARQFNSCRVNLDGKIAACQAGQQHAFISLKQQIEALDKRIQFLENKPSKHFELHQKKRRRGILLHRLVVLEEMIKQKKVRLCFGGKRLFHAQYHLEQNGFATHAEWKKNWEAQRNSEFFLLGSKDESSGNQTCTASLQSNGKLSLRLRLPKALEGQFGKYLMIHDVAFAYGQEAIKAALNQEQALSYRFKKDAKSWRVFVSTALKKAERISLDEHGVIGIDLNADHVAYVETDRFGNLVTKEVISWISYGKTKEQLKALTGDICKAIVDKAKSVKKPLVIEKLDFQTKKIALREGNKKFARLLSSFAYGQFFSFLTARACKHGIEIHRVNPAFTSITGRVNYAKRYGLSIHLAAAFCIARRYQKFSEAPCSPNGEIPDGKGNHVAFALPERNRTKHVWHFWGQVKKKLKAVLAAHYQARNRSLNPNPIHAIGNS